MRAVLIFMLVAAVFFYSMMEVDAHCKGGKSNEGKGKGSCAKCASPKHAESHFCTVDCTAGGGDDPPPVVGTTPS